MGMCTGGRAFRGSVSYRVRRFDEAMPSPWSLRELRPETSAAALSSQSFFCKGPNRRLFWPAMILSDSSAIMGKAQPRAEAKVLLNIHLDAKQAATAATCELLGFGAQRVCARKWRAPRSRVAFQSETRERKVIFVCFSR